MRHLLEFLDVTIRFIPETVHEVFDFSNNISGVVGVTTFGLLNRYGFAIFVVETSGNHVGLVLWIPRNHSYPLSIIPVSAGNKDAKRLFLKDLLDVIVGAFQTCGSVPQSDLGGILENLVDFGPKVHFDTVSRVCFGEVAGFEPIDESFHVTGI
jgi:hypothetical protein